MDNMLATATTRATPSNIWEYENDTKYIDGGQHLIAVHFVVLYQNHFVFVIHSIMLSNKFKIVATVARQEPASDHNEVSGHQMYPRRLDEARGALQKQQGRFSIVVEGRAGQRSDMIQPP